MGTQPMTPASVIPESADGSWRLAEPHASVTQGLLVSPFGHLPEGCALFLDLKQILGGAWLSSLRRACPITDATGKTEPAAAIAFTMTGLTIMQLDPAVLATFSPAFQEGMHQVDRKRRLSDMPDDGTGLADGPVWGGNTPDAFPDPKAASVTTPTTVHAVLLLYARDLGSLAAVEDAACAALQASGVVVSRRRELSLRFDEKKRAREHFGFADGLSQPVPRGDAIVSRTGGRLPDDKVHGIAAGDVLMGHINAQGEPAPGPVVSKTLDRGGLLPEHPTLEGFHDLGLDGSYLVLRELRQDVAAFWNSMHAGMGSESPDDAAWLASRVVGRTLDGDVLVPGGALPPVGEDPQNGFTFFDTDRHGLGCPIGSHVRRANPRDSLARDKESTGDLLTAAQNHRILRRGRKFGSTIEDPRVDDGADRGLLFACFNTDIVRQFEFVQQTWMLNTSFGTLLDESDPLLGPKGRFTIPASPLRLRPSVETFVRFVGGEYFFLPSLRALNYLQSLPVPAASAAP